MSGSVERHLKELWRKLGGLNQDLDGLDRRVAELVRPQDPLGRQRPFFGSETFVFDPFDVEPRESPLITSAGSVTRIERLTYTVSVISDGLMSGGLEQTWVMRPTARGCFIQIINGAFDDFRQTIGFDFEWALRMGPTGRIYTAATSQMGANDDGKGWLSRNSLGNPETGRQLLFSPKNPIVLKTADALFFNLRPILYTSFNTAGVPAGDAGEGWTQKRVQVAITYAGTRTFGYDS